MCVLISHFYNEEFLLPFWLKHHKRLFAHGIMIDYDSTDNSVDIIKEICPTWEIVKSKYKEFDSLLCNEEVMDIEKEIKGWKTALNTTEFLFVDELNLDLPSEVNGIKTQGIIMVDSEQDRYKQITENDLFCQRHYGFIEPAIGILGTGVMSRSRLIHKMPTGRYLRGRHELESYEGIFFTPNYRLLWFGWSPFEAIKRRKLQIQEKMSESDRIYGYGVDHIQTVETLEIEFLKMQLLSDDLLKNKDYNKMLNKIINKFNLKLEFPAIKTFI